jgi:hypothetical protein
LANLRFTAGCGSSGWKSGGTWSGFTTDDWMNPFSSGATIGRVNGSGSNWLSSGTQAAHLGARLYGLGIWNGRQNNTPPTVVALIADQSIAVGAPLSLHIYPSILLALSVKSMRPIR